VLETDRTASITVGWTEQPGYWTLVTTRTAPDLAPHIVGSAYWHNDPENPKKNSYRINTPDGVSQAIEFINNQWYSIAWAPDKEVYTSK
jgi:hypothetical protein